MAIPIVIGGYVVAEELLAWAMVALGAGAVAPTATQHSEAIADAAQAITEAVSAAIRKCPEKGAGSCC